MEKEVELKKELDEAVQLKRKQAQDKVEIRIKELQKAQ